MVLRIFNVLLYILELFGMEIKIDFLNGFFVLEMKREGFKKVVLMLVLILILLK